MNLGDVENNDLARAQCNRLIPYYSTMGYDPSIVLVIGEYDRIVPKHPSNLSWQITGRRLDDGIHQLQNFMREIGAHATRYLQCAIYWLESWSTTELASDFKV